MGVALLSFYQKRKFPLVSRDKVKLVSDGIANHLAKLPAKEPLSGRQFSLPHFPESELEMVWALDHFYGSEIIKQFLEREKATANGFLRLVHSADAQLVLSFMFLIASSVATGMTVGHLGLLDNRNWSFI